MSLQVESDVLDLSAKELLSACRKEARRLNISWHHYVSYLCKKSKRIGITDREEELLQLWLMKKIAKRNKENEQR